MKRSFTIVLLLLTVVSMVVSQEEKKSGWLSKLDNLKIKPTVNLQMWGVYTDGMEIYNGDNQSYEPVDNRLNFTLHRSRYGINMQPYKNLKFNFTLAADFIGRDALSSLDAGQNNGGNPVFRLWQTYLQLRMKPGKETAFLTFGYFSPRIGRESMTNPLRSTSMEKAWSQNYLRRHVVGTGPGRAVGMNFGGQLYEEGQLFSLKYDVGLFTPVYQAISGNSTGKEASALLVGRAVIMIGDPESKIYSMGHKPNHFGKRKGVSIGLAAATQGNTDLFNQSYTYGVDFLINVGQLNVDGDWHLMTREVPDAVSENKTTANTGYVRISYNYPLKSGYVLETAAALVQYNGEMESDGQLAASLTGMPAGEDQHIDLGLNFYFNPDLKLALHYTLRKGDAGTAGDGSRINNYFTSGAGAVRYGDWLGLGLSAIF